MPKRREEDFEIVTQKAREMEDKSQGDKLPEQAGLWSRLLPKQLFDYLPVGVALLNEQFVLCYCNKLYKEYINKYSRYSSDDAFGMRYFDLFPDSQNKLVEALRSVRDDRRQHIDIEAPLQLDLKAQMKQSYWNKRVIPIQDNDRCVTGILILALDVTEFVVAKKELQEKETRVKELKTTLRTLLKLRQEDRRTWERNTVANAKDAIIPFVGKLRQSLTRTDELICLDAIEAGINDLASDFSCQLGLDKYVLTPTEIQVAVLVREGKRSKEIAECLKVSPACIDFHRRNIRKKFGLKNTKVNLRSFLMEVAKRLP
jgi:DNA-binding CsgD family transcriptional regulator